jgi:hypothetical protein
MVVYALACSEETPGSQDFEMPEKFFLTFYCEKFQARTEIDRIVQ